VEDLQPPVEELRGERQVIVEVAVALDDVDLVALCVEQDMTPVVGDCADVGLPVDEPRPEV